MAAGHTQINSLQSTPSPRSEKKAAPMGDTKIGRHGRKYLVGSNGDKNAIPNPPFVIASSSPCEAAIKKKRKLRQIFAAQFPPSHIPTATPIMTANKIE
ncbi:MAG: hypothetical protein NVS9B14_12520 [Candidatus Acidiferrum sp.]